MSWFERSRVTDDTIVLMPLIQTGLARSGGNIDWKTREKLNQVFKLIDQRVQELAGAGGLHPSQARLLRPLHRCVLVGDDEVFVVLAVHDIGVTTIEQIQDWAGKGPMNLATAVFIVERDLQFRDAFGFRFERSALDLDGVERANAVARIAKRYWQDEVAHLERLNKVVNIVPIFQGRDFLLDESLVFVLSPFANPFCAIYKDHIKPTVESIANFRCIRADDIYDNRSIIEDIWRCIVQARIVVSELTGRNANVFYETGVAHTVGKEVVLITQSMSDVPFDLRHLRCVVYEYTPRGMSAFEGRLKKTIRNILSESRQR